MCSKIWKKRGARWLEQYVSSTAEDAKSGSRLDRIFEIVAVSSKWWNDEIGIMLIWKWFMKWVLLLLLLLTDVYDELFTRTVDILPLSDRINRIHSQTLSNLKLTSPDIKFPELHMEVYDGQP